MNSKKAPSTWSISCTGKSKISGKRSEVRHDEDDEIDQDLWADSAASCHTSFAEDADVNVACDNSQNHREPYANWIKLDWTWVQTI